MTNPKVLALVMAGGEGSRLDVLTDERAKPAMPYAGVYRLVDFPLSNCMHSGISDVWILQQYQPHSLNDHLSNGRPWDLDRTYGGLRLLHPHTGDPQSGWHQGNADAIYRNKTLIEEVSPEFIVVLSSDHVYKLDYADVVDSHVERKADLTMVTTRVPIDEAARFGVVQISEEGTITNYDYKPESPASDIVTTEVFVFSTEKLLKLLEELAADGKGDDEEGLEDLGDTVLPRLVEAGRAYEFPLDGYWRDVGTVESYWQSHMDLLDPEPRIDLDDPKWPIHTLGAQRPPAHIYDSARIDNSLISPGCMVRGQVLRSVLGPGVVVDQGAIVRDSIILEETSIARGATVARAIVDMDVVIGEEAEIGHDPGTAQASQHSDSDIALVGRRARVLEGARVGAQDRIKPGAEQRPGSPART